MDAVERRALVLLVPIAVLLVFLEPAVDFAGPKKWQLILGIVGTICVVAAAVLALIVTVPNPTVNLVQAQRERLSLVAVALLVADVVVIGILRSYALYYAYKHPSG